MPTPPLLDGLPSLVARRWLLPVAATAEAIRELMGEALEHLDRAASEPEPLSIPHDPKPYEQPTLTERKRSVAAALDSLDAADEMLRKELRADLASARAALQAVQGLLEAER